MGEMGQILGGEHVYVENLWREKTLYIYIFLEKKKYSLSPLPHFHCKYLILRGLSNGAISWGKQNHFPHSPFPHR